MRAEIVLKTWQHMFQLARIICFGITVQHHTLPRVLGPLDSDSETR